MLTRLQVDGFKNLESVDVRFGPFTCIAGPNAAGKSNLFDAIAFLSALADKPLMDAALSVRGGGARGDVRSLFRRSGSATGDHMRFQAEFLIPLEGEDPLGQRARASMTFLEYDLALRFRPDPVVPGLGALEIAHERLVHINQSVANRRLGFKSTQAWRRKAVQGRRTSPYLSTEDDGSMVLLHADSQGGLGGGRPRRIPAAGLPRTLLSSVNNAVEHRTMVLARQEMASWTQLQLEPSALRAPDGLTAPRTMAPNGAHLAMTLFAQAQSAEQRAKGGADDLYARVANRLSELVEDVRSVRVELDERRQLLSVVLTDRRDTEHVASALSDGTLRFLALTVMEADPRSRPLLCLEEPENGVHPLRIPAILRLLKDLAVDPSFEIDADNPLRQVIINTHSPTVVANVHDDELLIARATDADGGLELVPLAETWRDTTGRAAAKGDLLAYLDPTAIRPRRVATDRRLVRETVQLGLFGSLAAEPPA